MAGEEPLYPNAVHTVRTVMTSTLSLSQMADQKANMVMGAAFVVFTLTMGQVRAGGHVVPVAILAGGALIAAILAILCVMPSISSSRGAPGPGDNVLFFGVFTRMSEREFADTVIDALHSDEAAYRLMLRDVYQNGVVLARRKYRLLGYAYRALLAGIVGSALALGIELAL